MGFIIINVVFWSFFFTLIVYIRRLRRQISSKKGETYEAIFLLFSPLILAFCISIFHLQIGNQFVNDKIETATKTTYINTFLGQNWSEQQWQDKLESDFMDPINHIRYIESHFKIITITIHYINQTLSTHRTKLETIIIIKHKA